MRQIISDYTRLLRLPGLAGLSIAPVFGAISVGVLDLIPLSILFLIGAFTSIYGFVLNDIIDVNVDKLSKELSNRPLVKGTISKKTALLICSLCFIGALITIFLVFYTPPRPAFFLGLLCILLSAGLGTVYNIYGKKLIGSDFLVALSEAFLVLFGALMVIQTTSQLTLFTWVIFILTFCQLLFMNAIEGGIKDADHDPLMNVKNIALASGVRVTDEQKLIIPASFKIFGFAIQLCAVTFVFVPFIVTSSLFTFEIWHLIHLFLLALFAIGVLFISAKLLMLHTFERNKIRKLITAETFLRYSLVPLMLIPLIDILPAILLLILPFIWYILFAPLIGEKLFRPGL
ncbi:MAG: UbiA family prenyltransferase [Euryarchaeota archaeon]|nr:UbiA family prenyltransferase [Euryarchaeota archaeon]